jgi:hypothetical protein
MAYGEFEGADDMTTCDVMQQALNALEEVIEFPVDYTDRATVREAITALRAALAQEKSSGLSWSGFNIYGDSTSVKEVRRLIEFEGARSSAQSRVIRSEEGTCYYEKDEKSVDVHEESEEPVALWATLMETAACLEIASYSIHDDEARKSAIGACEYARAQAKRFASPARKLTDEDKRLLTETPLISAAYESLRSTRTIAIDDYDYDLFAAGWKAAIDADRALEQEWEK